MAEPADNTIISLRNVHKRFGKLVVLDGINLDIETGKTTVIIGPSGTGKSVLLKHIVGLLRPDSGEVYFDKQRVDTLTETELVPLRTQFGYLFQMGALFDSMNVRDNICFPLFEHTDMNSGERAERCRQALGWVGLDGSQTKMPSELSGGQRKRIALARAVALHPRVILYDEPTTGLDPINSDVINDLIIKLREELKATAIAVTHDMTSAYKIADRMVMLYDGNILADGGPDEFRRSEDPVVRGFVEGKAYDEAICAIRADET